VRTRVSDANLVTIWSFPKIEKLESERIDEQRILDGKTYQMLDNNRNHPYPADLFVNDALFLSGVSSRFITLKSPRITGS
jgi:hypothetical protein